MSWRVQVADPISQEGIQRLRQQAEVIEQETVDDLQAFDALVVRGRTLVGRRQIESGSPRLKVIGRAGVGIDNIDLQAAADGGVIVVNAPLAATNAVAELALAMMFALARDLPAADRSMEAGRWEKRDMEGTELAGKSLGILGVGRIGQALARKAEALEMRVLGHDPRLTAADVEQRGAHPVSLLDLFADAHFVSVHVPLSPDTYHMVGERELQAARPGLYLITTARGGVVDETSLLGALESGRLAGAALDVFEQEPPGATPLILHPRVLTTPHIGAQTQQGQRRAAVDIAEEVLAALNGEPLRWQVH